jgi:hypothetical protein
MAPAAVYTAGRQRYFSETIISETKAKKFPAG